MEGPIKESMGLQKAEQTLAHSNAWRSPRVPRKSFRSLRGGVGQRWRESFWRVLASRRHPLSHCLLIVWVLLTHVAADRAGRMVDGK